MAATLMLYGCGQHKSDWLKSFGSRTASHSGAQLAEAAKPQSEALACCQFVCSQYKKVTQPWVHYFLLLTIKKMWPLATAKSQHPLADHDRDGCVKTETSPSYNYFAKFQ